MEKIVFLPEEMIYTEQIKYSLILFLYLANMRGISVFQIEEIV